MVAGHVFTDLVDANRTRLVLTGHDLGELRESGDGKSVATNIPDLSRLACDPLRRSTTDRVEDSDSALSSGNGIRVHIGRLLYVIWSNYDNSLPIFNKGLHPIRSQAVFCVDVEAKPIREEFETIVHRVESNCRLAYARGPCELYDSVGGEATDTCSVVER